MKLKDMVIVFDDGDWIESKDQSSEGVRLLQTGNIGEGYFVNKAERKKFISEETFEKLKCKEVYSGDILISRLPEPVGRACIVPELDSRLITAVDCTICRINEDIVNKEYLCYFFQSQSYYNQVKQKVAGTTRKRISRKNLEQIKVYLPLLDIQGKIVQKLNTVSELISYRKKQLEDFDLLVKSQFVEMFGDCVINSKGWKTKRLEDIAKVGSSKRVFVEELQDSGIPFYRGTEVGALAEGKQIVPELFITEKHYVELCETTGVPQIGDLLMPSICPDGRIWVVNTDEPFYFKDGRVLWVHVIDNSYNSIFLLYTLKDRIMTDYNSIASGTTFAELKIFALKKCQIFDVPLALQNEFATFVQQVDKSKFISFKSQFIEMFGDPIENEKGWRTIPLLQTGKCKNGMNYSSKDCGVEMHCLGVADFQDNAVIDDMSVLPMVSLKESPNTDYLLQNGDIVFVRSNGNRALVGRSVVVYPGDEPVVYSGFCIRYRKEREELLTDYLLRFFKTDSVRAKMAGRGANIQNLNQQILAALNIPIPPIEMQKEFSVFVKQSDKSK